MCFVVLFASMLTFRLGINEQHIKIIGLILQLIGIGLTVNGAAYVVRSLRQWINGVPIPTTNLGSSNIGMGNVVLPASTMGKDGATGLNWASPKDETPDARVATLERNLETLHKQVYPIAALLSKEKRGREAALTEESYARQNADIEILKKIEKHGTDGLYRSAMGMWCIFNGVILCTVPDLFK